MSPNNSPTKDKGRTRDEGKEMGGDDERKLKGKRSILAEPQAKGESYKRAKDRRWQEEDKCGLDAARLRRRTAAAKRAKDLVASEVYTYMKDKEVKDAHKESMKLAEQMKSDGKIKDIRSYFK